MGRRRFPGLTARDGAVTDNRPTISYGGSWWPKGLDPELQADDSHARDTHQSTSKHKRGHSALLSQGDSLKFGYKKHGSRQSMGLVPRSDGMVYGRCRIAAPTRYGSKVNFRGNRYPHDTKDTPGLTLGNCGSRRSVGPQCRVRVVNRRQAAKRSAQRRPMRSAVDLDLGPRRPNGCRRKTFRPRSRS